MSVEPYSSWRCWARSRCSERDAQPKHWLCSLHAPGSGRPPKKAAGALCAHHVVFRSPPSRSALGPPSFGDTPSCPYPALLHPARPSLVPRPSPNTDSEVTPPVRVEAGPPASGTHPEPRQPGPQWLCWAGSIPDSASLTLRSSGRQFPLGPQYPHAEWASSCPASPVWWPQ